MGLTEKLTEIKSETDALLNFANETTGQSDSRLGDAVLTLASGFGTGSGGMISGEISFDSSAYTSLPINGYTIDGLWNKRPKIFFMFIERNEWEKMDAFQNNAYSSIILLDKEIFGNIVQTRINGTTIQDYSNLEVIPVVNAYVVTVSDKPAPSYPTNLFGGQVVSQNNNVWDMTDTGVIISRFSSAGAYLYPCKYKWIAFY